MKEIYVSETRNFKRERKCQTRKGILSTKHDRFTIKSSMRLLFLVLIVFSSVICSSSVPVKKKSSDPWLDVSLKEDIGMRYPKL